MTQDYVSEDNTDSEVPGWFAEAADSHAVSEGDASRKGKKMFVSLSPVRQDWMCHRGSYMLLPTQVTYMSQVFVNPAYLSLRALGLSTHSCGWNQ